MIKNIVFDMGKVLVEYDPDRVCRQFTDNEEEIKKICMAVFASSEWTMLDMGIISEEEGLKRMLSRLDTQRERTLATDCFNHWHEYNMYAKAEMGGLVRCLKEQGYGIYLCSNASVRLLTCYRNTIPGIEVFDGVLFSAEILCMKPQRQMYETLFQRFSLKPEECFFIDDLNVNIEGARACGMDGYCFADGNVEKLREVLKNLNRK